MLYIVNAFDGQKYFVEAKDAVESISILYAVDIDADGATAEPYEQEVRRGVKVYTVEDAMVPILGGTYILKLKDISGWVEVATCRFGPLWTDIYENAAKTYGADNVDYSFKLDRETTPEVNSYDF